VPLIAGNQATAAQHASAVALAAIVIVVAASAGSTLGSR